MPPITYLAGERVIHRKAKRTPIIARVAHWLILVTFIFPLFKPNVGLAQPIAPAITLAAVLTEATVATVRVKVTGSGFTCTSAVTFMVRNSANSGPNFTTQPLGKGDISLEIDIPINKKADVWTVTASQFVPTPLPGCQRSASAKYYAFSWNPAVTMAAPGSALQITGSHFPPGREMPLGFIDSKGTSTSLGTIIANASGILNRTVNIPANATTGTGRFTITYDRVSTGVITIPFNSSKSFGVATDLSITHLEITQVIQRWDNSVPLVAGKPTVVRVYVQANGNPSGTVAGTIPVDWPLMDVYRGTSYLGTIGPTNRPILVAPTPVDPKSLRADAFRTFNFLLPSAWASGDIRIHVTINTTLSTPDTNHANDTTSADLTFVKTRDLHIVGLMYADPDYPYPAVPYSNYTEHLNYVRRTWPVARVILHQPASPALKYEKLLNLDPNNSPYFPGSGQIIADTEKRRLQATDSWKNYYWYVLAPWDTCNCGLADFPPVQSAIGQDNRSEAAAGTVMAQEIGHNHNQLHTGHVDSFVDPNCCPHGGISQDPNDPAFGFDTGKMAIIPPGDLNGIHAHDFMSYGSAPIWVSDYSYEGLLDELRITAESSAGAASVIDLVTANRPYIIISGIISESSGVIQPTYIQELPEGSDDLPGSGEYALELRDGSDQVLFTRFFGSHASTHEHEGPVTFSQLLPYHVETQKVVLLHHDEILAELTASANAPEVTITRPAAGVHWNGARQVEWQASDADQDPLVFAVQYSSDNGATWQPLAVDLTGNVLDLDANFLKGSTTCLVRVLASDGLRTTIALSGIFGVDPHAPVATILTLPLLTGNNQALLKGEGFDADDGPLPEESLMWSSDRDGLLGTGTTLVTEPLSGGRHVISLTATDADQTQTTVTTTVEINSPLYLPSVLTN